MDLSPLYEYIVKCAAAGGGGVVALAYGIFKFFGSKWLEAKFDKRFQI